jgi:hypothetical protein
MGSVGWLVGWLVLNSPIGYIVVPNNNPNKKLAIHNYQNS